MATLTDKARALQALCFRKPPPRGTLTATFATLCCALLRPRCSATWLTGFHGTLSVWPCRRTRLIPLQALSLIGSRPCQQARSRYRPVACPVLDGTCGGSPVPPGPPAAVNCPCICHCHGSGREAGKPATAPVLCHLAGAPCGGSVRPSVRSPVPRFPVNCRLCLPQMGGPPLDSPRPLASAACSPGRSRHCAPH